jgi:uncharacterized protein YegJ (DUF2314 family)
MKHASLLILLFVALLAGCDRKPAANPPQTPASTQPQASEHTKFFHKDDGAMNAAFKQARASIGDFKKVLAAPAKGQSHMYIKAPFTDGVTTEHMWVEDISFKDGVFSGTIANDPLTISNYKYEQAVTVKESTISDWQYVQDGKLVGGFTLRKTLNDLTPQRREEFLKSLPYTVEEAATSAP